MGRSEQQHDGSIKVIYEDDRFTPAETVAAFHKLVSTNKVDLIVVIASTPANAIAGLAEAGRIPLIAWASDEHVSRGRALVVRSYPSGFAEGEHAAREAARRGYQRVALVTTLNDYTESWKAGVLAAMPKSLLLLSEELPGDLKDYRSLILRARERGAREYLLCVNPGQAGLLAKQARELGGAERFGGCEYLHDRAELETSGGALKGAWFPTVQVSEEFRERYFRKFGNESVLSGAANHYDLVMLLRKLPAGARGKDLVRAMVALGAQAGAVGAFQVKEAADDRFFDIPLKIKEVS